MERFEYQILVWPANDPGTGVHRALNQLGSQGWEAVGLTSRAMPTPVAGMGAKVVPEVVVLLKRRVPARQ